MRLTRVGTYNDAVVFIASRADYEKAGEPGMVEVQPVELREVLAWPPLEVGQRVRVRSGGQEDYRGVVERYLPAEGQTPEIIDVKTDDGQPLLGLNRLVWAVDAEGAEQSSAA